MGDAGVFVKINGRDEAVKAAAGGYLTLARTWNDGDVIELQMPFGFRLVQVHGSAESRQSLLRPGAAGGGRTRATRANWRPITLDASDISRSITGDPRHAAFLGGGCGVQTVLRNLRPALGLLARHVQVTPSALRNRPSYVRTGLGPLRSSACSSRPDCRRV